MTDLGITAPSSSYSEDTQHVDGEKGAMIFGIRNDTPSSLVDTDGDRAPFQFDSLGRLRCASSASLTLDVSQDTGVVDATTLRVTIGTDDTVLTATNASLTVIERWGAKNGSALDLEFGVMNVLEAKDFDGSALPNTVSEGQAVRSASTLSGIPFNFLVNEDGSKTLALVEDVAHVSGDLGIQALAVRNDQLAALGGTDGDYAPLQVDKDGAAYVNANIPITPTHMSPVDGTVAYTSNVTITCSGFPFTVADANC